MDYLYLWKTMWSELILVLNVKKSSSLHSVTAQKMKMKFSIKISSVNVTKSTVFLNP